MSYRSPLIDLSSDSESDFDDLILQGVAKRRVLDSMSSEGKESSPSCAVLALSHLSLSSDSDGGDGIENCFNKSAQVSISSSLSSSDDSLILSRHEEFKSSLCSRTTQLQLTEKSGKILDDSSDGEEAFDNFLSNFKKAPAKNVIESDSDESCSNSSEVEDSMADFIVPDDVSITSGSDDSAFYIKTNNLLQANSNNKKAVDYRSASFSSENNSQLVLSSSSDEDSLPLLERGPTPPKKRKLKSLVNKSLQLSSDEHSSMEEDDDISSLKLRVLNISSDSQPVHSEKLIELSDSDDDDNKQALLELSGSSDDSETDQLLDFKPEVLYDDKGTPEKLCGPRSRIMSLPNGNTMCGANELLELNDSISSMSLKLLDLSDSEESDFDDVLQTGINVFKSNQTPIRSSPYRGSDSLPSLNESDDDDDTGPVQIIDTPFVTRLKSIEHNTLQTAKVRTVSSLTPFHRLPVKTRAVTGSKTEPRKTNTRCDFLASLSQHFSETRRRHPEASRYVMKFKQSRDELTEKLKSLYNSSVFDGKLSSVDVSWNKRLLKTAGRCEYKSTRTTKQKLASVELSEKVCNSAERVRDTLIHELCHAAVWIINGVQDGHGMHWQYWTRKAMLIHSDLPPIRRCHSYEISTKYTYRCTKCGYEVGRHSKSLDTTRFSCGKCRGCFTLLTTQANGMKTPAKTPNKFALYVKENYGSVKKSQGSASHAEVMKALGEAFSRGISIV